MVMLATASTLLAFASFAKAHMAPYLPSASLPILPDPNTANLSTVYQMYGDFDTMNPSTPIGPNFQFDDWWMRGPMTRATGPGDGSVTALPAGGEIVLEIACNEAFTSGGVSPSDNEACPNNTGAYHSGVPGEPIDYSLLSGCALGIADVDDINLVTVDNMAIFSVQHECVYKRDTTFEIPAKMPACTGSKCICAWFWLANNGTANWYQTPFDCAVTGSPSDATPISMPLKATQYCGDEGGCITGARQPMYIYNYDYVNTEWLGNNNRPGYHASWGWANGAQDDIFAPAGTVYPPANNTLPAPTTPATYSFAGDLALKRPVTASSYATGQPPSDAVDGVISGYVANGSGNDQAEWSSNGEGAGAWLKVTLSKSYKVNQVVVYDRPNLNDHCTGGTLTFDDKSVVSFGDMPNDGSALSIVFPGRYTKTIKWTCTVVSAYTTNIGLQEIQVYANVIAPVSSGVSGASSLPVSSAISSGVPSAVVSSAVVSSAVSSPVSSAVVSSTLASKASSAVVSSTLVSKTVVSGVSSSASATRASSAVVSSSPSAVQSSVISSSVISSSIISSAQPVKTTTKGKGKGKPKPKPKWPWTSHEGSPVSTNTTSTNSSTSTTTTQAASSVIKPVPSSSSAVKTTVKPASSSLPAVKTTSSSAKKTSTIAQKTSTTTTKAVSSTAVSTSTTSSKLPTCTPIVPTTVSTQTTICVKGRACSVKPTSTVITPSSMPCVSATTTPSQVLSSIVKPSSSSSSSSSAKATTTSAKPSSSSPAKTSGAAKSTKSVHARDFRAREVAVQRAEDRRRALDAEAVHKPADL